MAERTLDEAFKIIEELQAKVRVVEDIEQIKELHIRFKNAHVACNHPGEAACFTEDGVLELCEYGNVMRIDGKVAIGGFDVDFPMPASPFTEGGFVVHPEITVEGDKAKGKWVNYNLFAVTVTKQSVFWMQATENAEYVRENGEWKISHLKWELQFGLPAQVN